MRKSVNAALIQSEETTEELVGILTAISIVSKRLAKKLAPMPIKAAPYRHQIEAFNFVCTKFGLVHGGEAVENKVPQMRESDQPKAK